MIKRVTRTVVPKHPSVRVPVLILSVIIDPEYQAVTELLPKVGATRIAQSDVDRVLEIDRWSIEGSDHNFEIATAYINGMGNARSAIETLIYLQRMSPKFMFLCGIAGTLNPTKANLGDVVVARAVQWWNLNKVTKDETKLVEDGLAKYLRLDDHYFRKDIRTVGEPTSHWNKQLTDFSVSRKKTLRSNTEGELLNLRTKLQRKNIRQNLLHYDRVVSWEYVLSDEALRDRIRSDSEGGLAIEMEGGGFATSIKRRNEEVDARQRLTGTEMPGDTIGFVVRGISDVCHDKGAEPKEWRKVAMYNAAGVVVDFLKTFSEIDFTN